MALISMIMKNFHNFGQQSYIQQNAPKMCIFHMTSETTGPTTAMSCKKRNWPSI